VYVAEAHGTPKAGDDAKGVQVFDPLKPPALAFDHALVLSDYRSSGEWAWSRPCADMADATFLDYVVEQLAEARGLKVRPMFGGHGLYMSSNFFGIVHKGALYFRTDEASRPAYVKAGCRPFIPGAGRNFTATTRCQRTCWMTLRNYWNGRSGPPRPVTDQPDQR